MLPIIRLLDQTLINQIAAGEVIERPAAAIKELVENAIDAGAANITVTVREGGRSFIEVVDDGHGMTQEGLRLAVQRHATSKLPDEDLFNIHTFGFRGEALPSIASVSRTTITTRPKDADMGWCLSIEGGIEQNLMPKVASVGTTITVRDLFYATPARLKFLKTIGTELSHCVDLMNRIALSHPHVGITLKDDAKVIFSYASNQNFDQRVGVILKQTFLENSTQFSYEVPSMKARGRLSFPTYNRSQSTEQFFFVNNRPVRDKMLAALVRAAYQDFLPHNRHPVVVMFLDVHPEDVDVNVHPAKAEVRFRDAQGVRSVILGAMKETLMHISQKTSTHLAAEAVAMFEKPFTRESLNAQKAYVQQQFSAPASRPNYGGGQRTYVSSADKVASPFPQHDMQPVVTMPTAAPENLNYPLGMARAQIHATYILAEKQDSLVIIDQHAAHERLTYEKLKHDFASQTVKQQTLLIPEMVILLKQEIEILQQYHSLLIGLGFALEFFEPTTLVVRGVPAILNNISIPTLMQDLVDDLRVEGAAQSLQDHIMHILATVACHNSIRSGRTLQLHEMNALLRQMEATPHSGQCNHGRPAYVELKKTDLEKLFERA